MATDDKQKPLSEYSVGGKTYSCSKLPPVNLIRWGRSNGYEQAFKEELITVTGYADCFNFDTVQGIKFSNQYWSFPFDLAMEGAGLWLFIQTNAVGVKAAIEAKEKGEDAPEIEGVLCLMDKSFMLEVITRNLEPLEFTETELQEFLGQLLPYSLERISKAKERHEQSATLRLKDELNLPESALSEIQEVIARHKNNGKVPKTQKATSTVKA